MMDTQEGKRGMKMARSLGIMILWAELVLAPISLAAKLGGDPPPSAKTIPCVGTAARKVCVGDERIEVVRLLGIYAETEAWTRNGEDIRVYELNRGRAACWFTIIQKTERVKKIQCIGL